MGDLFPIFFFRILTFDIRSLIRNLIFFYRVILWKILKLFRNDEIISKREGKERGGYLKNNTSEGLQGCKGLLRQHFYVLHSR